MFYNGVLVEDVVQDEQIRSGVDTSIMLRIKYIGSQAAAHVTLAATTGDMTFEQGATTAAAAVTTGTNPGTSGVIDISNTTTADVSTLHKLVGQINLAKDWHAWLVDVPGDFATEISAGNCAFITTLADQDCTGENGFAMLLDTSLGTAEVHYVGVTMQGPPDNPHPTDHNVLHQIFQVKATATYGAGNETITIYACDDDDGTKTAIYGPVAGAATTVEKVIPTAYCEVPLAQVTGKRISVLMANDTGEHTVTTLSALRRSAVVGPAIDPRRSWSSRCQSTG